MHILRRLRIDHALIRMDVELLEDIISSDPQTVWPIRAQFLVLRACVAEHEQREEDTLYPLINTWLTEPSEPCFDLVREDHAAIDQLFRRLDELTRHRLRAPSPDIPPLVTELAQQLKDHLAWEVSVLFPACYYQPID